MPTKDAHRCPLPVSPNHTPDNVCRCARQATATCPAGEMVQLWSGALHPRNPSLLCTAGSNDVQVRTAAVGCTVRCTVVAAQRNPCSR